MKRSYSKGLVPLIDSIAHACTQNPRRSHSACRQRVCDSGRRVDICREGTNQCGENNDLHDHSDRGNSRHVQNRGKRTGLHLIRIPRQQADQQGNRAHVEHQNAPNHRANRLRHRAPRIIGLGGGNGNNLKPAKGGNNRKQTNRDSGKASRSKTTISNESLMQALSAPGNNAHQKAQSNDQEEDNCRDFQSCKPRLNTTEFAGRQKVNPAQDNNDDQSDNPLVNTGEPSCKDLRCAGHFQAKHHDQHEPVQPARGEACPPADSCLGVGRKRSRGRNRSGQLSQRIHHGDNDECGKDVGHQNGRAGLGNGDTGTQEEAGTNRASQRHHRQVCSLESF